MSKDYCETSINCECECEGVHCPFDNCPGFTLKDKSLLDTRYNREKRRDANRLIAKKLYYETASLPPSKKAKMYHKAHQAARRAHTDSK